MKTTSTGSAPSPAFSFLSPSTSGVKISILVQPRAARSKLVGEHDGRLKIQLAAPPVDGEANKALIQLLCDILQLPRRQILITSGPASRRKVVRIQGLNLNQVRSILSEVLL